MISLTIFSHLYISLYLNLSYLLLYTSFLLHPSPFRRITDNSAPCSGRHTLWRVKNLAEMLTFDDKGRAREADDETLYYRTSDLLLAFRLRKSPAKIFATIVLHYF
jgi:hypothetical protein